MQHHKIDAHHGTQQHRQPSLLLISSRCSFYSTLSKNAQPLRRVRLLSSNKTKKRVCDHKVFYDGARVFAAVDDRDREKGGPDDEWAAVAMTMVFGTHNVRRIDIRAFRFQLTRIKMERNSRQMACGRIGTVPATIKMPQR